MIATGSAKLIVDGKIVHPKTAGLHEIRGSFIEGGLEKTLGGGRYRAYSRQDAPSAPSGKRREVQSVLTSSIQSCMLYVYTRKFAMPLLQTTESVSINIRAKVRQRDLIDQAAERLGRSRSEFMLDASCRMAEDVLLDQAFFTVNAAAFARLQELIDRPLPPNSKLRRLLKTKAPWEK